MKKTHIAMLLVIGAAIMLLISSSDNYSRYVDFAEAMEFPGTEFQLIGVLEKDKAMTYDPVKDPNYFSFFLNDEAGVQKKVVYLGAKPADFERSEDIVLTGSMNGDEFHASKILLKCPSKYNDGEIEVKEFEATKT